MSQPLLEVRNATKIYRGGFLQPGQQLVALQDFNLTIPEEPATITAIAGESGSGKTTLANLILGFISPTSGQILYRGQNIVTMSTRQKLEYARQVQAIERAGATEHAAFGGLISGAVARERCYTEGDWRHGMVSLGPSIAFARRIEPLQAIVNDLVDEAVQAIAALRAAHSPHAMEPKE